MSLSIFSKTKSRQVAMIALITLAAILGGTWLAVKIYVASYSTATVEEAVLLLAFENGGKGRMFQGEVIEGMTILDALVTSANAGRIAFEYSFDENGKIMIQELDGHKNSEGSRLAFYLNNKPVNADQIFKTLIQGGDFIKVDLK